MRKTLINNAQKGFTLIELSIVLVILAVIAGGILAGQNLIKTAELNAFATDVERFKFSFDSFQAKYQQLPGDMDTAYDYWAADCADTEAICNGNGNAKTFIKDNEVSRAWKHLSLSKMIDSYIAVLRETEPDSAKCILGETMPYTSIDGVSGGFNYFDGTQGFEAASKSVPNVGQFLQFTVTKQGSSISDCIESGSGAFTAEQLYILDKKLDDGYAYSGKILNSENLTGCTTSKNEDLSDLDDEDYDLENNGVNLCDLFVRLKVQ